MADPDFTAVYEDKKAPPAPQPAPVVTEPTEAEPPKEPKKSSAEIIEEEARTKGWKPADEWDGDPKEWRDASVFLERGRYFNTMQSQKNMIANLEGQLKTLVNLQKNIRLDERKKVLAELQRKKTEAINDGDYGTVLELERSEKEYNERAKQEDAHLDNIARQSATQQAAPQMTAQQASQRMVEFIADNPWYVKDPVKRQVADVAAKEYRAANPGADLEAVLRHISTIGGKTTGNVPPAATGAPSTTTSPSPKRGNKKKTLTDLSPMHREIGQRFVRDGAFASIDDYIAELERIGEL